MKQEEIIAPLEDPCDLYEENRQLSEALSILRDERDDLKRQLETLRKPVFQFSPAGTSDPSSERSFRISE